MRLIDVDELLILETVAYNKAQAKINDKITRLVNEVVHKKIQMLVSDAPTAYDVDKVVEQLKNEKEFWSDATYNKEIGKQKARSYEHAIEIVKGGGVNE